MSAGFFAGLDQHFCCVYRCRQPGCSAVTAAALSHKENSVRVKNLILGCSLQCCFATVSGFGVNWQRLVVSDPAKNMSHAVQMPAARNVQFMLVDTKDGNVCGCFVFFIHHCKLPLCEVPPIHKVPASPLYYV